MTMRTTEPKYQQVAAALREDIARGIYRAGERMPSENELVARFDVSLITARRAYSELSASGEVQRIKGKGTFVAPSQGRHPGGRQTAAKLISFVMLDYREADESILQIILGAQETLSHAGFQMIIGSGNHDTDSEEAILEHCHERGINGVLLFSNNPDSSVSTARKLTNSAIPVVFIDRSPTRQPCSVVASNNYDGGYRLAEHLLERGHRRILFAGDRGHIDTERRRYAGFRDCLQNEGCFDQSLCFFNSYAQLERLMNHLTRAKATAICCVNDKLAIWLMDRLQERGLRVPQDVALTGFDDLALARRIGLTSMRQDFGLMGSQAAELLLTWLEHPGGQGMRAVAIPVELQVRSSTQSPREA